MDGAVLKSLVGDVTLSTSLGGVKQVKYEWNAKNNWTLKVPTKVVYTDSFGERKVAHENYAQVLLDSYPGYFRLVGMEKEPEVVQKETVEVKKRGRPKREKVEEVPEDADAS